MSVRMVTMETGVRPRYVLLAIVVIAMLLAVSSYGLRSMHSEPPQLSAGRKQSVAKMHAETDAALAMSRSRPHQQLPRYASRFCNWTHRYPVEAVRHNHEGTAVLRVLVAADGKASRIELQTTSGFSELDKAATQDVGCWRFQPDIRNGKPIEAWVVVPVKFSISSM